MSPMPSDRVAQQLLPLVLWGFYLCLADTGEPTHSPTSDPGGDGTPWYSTWIPWSLLGGLFVGCCGFLNGPCCKTPRDRLSKNCVDPSINSAIQTCPLLECCCGQADEGEAGRATDVTHVTSELTRRETEIPTSIMVDVDRKQKMDDILYKFHERLCRFMVFNKKQGLKFSSIKREQTLAERNLGMELDIWILSEGRLALKTLSKARNSDDIKVYPFVGTRHIKEENSPKRWETGLDVMRRFIRAKALPDEKDKYQAYNKNGAMIYIPEGDLSKVDDSLRRLYKTFFEPEYKGIKKAVDKRIRRIKRTIEERAEVYTPEEGDANLNKTLMQVNPTNRFHINFVGQCSKDTNDLDPTDRDTKLRVGKKYLLLPWREQISDIVRFWEDAKAALKTIPPNKPVDPDEFGEHREAYGEQEIEDEKSPVTGVV